MPMTLDAELVDRGRWRGTAHCSVAKVFDLLNTKTTFLILRELFYGTTRFEDFVDRIDTSAPATSRALKQLEVAGIVARFPYRDPGARVRDEYRLTDAGEDLLPTFMAITHWGDTHLQDGSPPLSFVDARTGRPVRVFVTADDDRPSTASADIEVRPTFRFD
ncbi:transcriptional regulator [Mycolicibacterium sp. P1-18]|nr:transcriptional regulator [Mycolicibacterium sp. P1-18]